MKIHNLCFDDSDYLTIVIYLSDTEALAHFLPLEKYFFKVSARVDGWIEIITVN